MWPMTFITIAQLEDQQDQEDLIEKVHDLSAQCAVPQGQHHTLERDDQQGECGNC